MRGVEAENVVSGGAGARRSTASRPGLESAVDSEEDADVDGSAGIFDRSGPPQAVTTQASRARQQTRTRGPAFDYTCRCLLLGSSLDTHDQRSGVIFHARGQSLIDKLVRQLLGVRTQAQKRRKGRGIGVVVDAICTQQPIVARL